MTKLRRTHSTPAAARMRLALLGSTAFMSLAALLPAQVRSAEIRIEPGVTTLSADEQWGVGELVMLGGTLALAGHRQTVTSLEGDGIIQLQDGSLNVNQASSVEAYSGGLDLSGANDAAVFEKRGLGRLILGGRITGGWGVLSVNEGTLDIYGDNDFTGQVDIYNATLIVGGDTALGAAEVFAWDSGARIEAAQDVVLANNISIRSPSSGSLTIGGAHDIQLDGVVGGAGRKLVKQGSGTLTLNNYNSYNGTLLQQGAISVTQNQGLGLGMLTASAGTTLKLADGITLANYNPLKLDGDMTLDVADGNVVIDSAISGAGGLTKTGDGVVTLDVTNTYGGVTRFNGGSVVMGVLGALPGYGAVDFNGGKLVVHRYGTILGPLTGTSGAIELVDPNYRLVIEQSTDTTYAGTIGGVGIFGKQGAGVLTLSGEIGGDDISVEAVQGTLVLNAANSYTGGTVIDNGARLVVGDDAALGAGYLLASTFEAKLESNKAVTLANNVFIQRGPALYANLAVEGSHDLRLDGVVGELGATGYGGALIKRGAGTLTLAGHNTYTQGTVLSGGVVRALTEDAFGAGWITVVAPSGVSLGAGLTIANGVTLDDTLSVNAEGAGATLSGTIDGAGGLQVAGGSLTLTGVIDYSGATTLLADANLTFGATATGGTLGSITVGDGVLTVNRADDFMIEELHGGGAFVQAGPGVTRLYHDGSFTGDITIADGTLHLSSPGALGDAASVSLSGADAVLDLGMYDNIGAATTVRNFSGAAGSTVKLGQLGMLIVRNDGEGVFAGTIQGAADPRDVGTLYSQGTGALTLTGQNDLRNVWVEMGTLALADGGTLGDRADVEMYQSTLDLSGVTGAAAAIRSLSGQDATVALGATTLTLVNPGDEFLGAFTGTGGLHIQDGWLGLTGAQSYTGETRIDQTASLYIAAADFAGAMRVEGALDIAQYPFDSVIGGLSGSGAVALGDNRLTLNGGGAFDGVIDGGTGGLTLAAGTTVLTGTNLYSGATEIGAQATLTLSGGGSIANSAVRADGVFDIAGANGPMQLVSLQGGGEVRLGANRLSFVNDSTFDGVISGAGGLDIAGGQRVTLTGANTYSGVTTIDSGATLRLADGGGLAQSAVTVGGALDLAGTTADTAVGGLSGGGDVTLGAYGLALNGGGAFDGVISGDGGLRLASGTQVLTGANTYAGQTRVDAGAALTLTGSIAGGPLAIDGRFDASGAAAPLTANGLAGAGTVVLGADPLTLTGGGVFSGAVQGLGGLTFAAGSSTLSGVNSYTGPTTIDGGAILHLAGPGSIAGSAVVATGAFDISGATGGVTIANLSGSGVVSLGGNTLTLGADGQDSAFTGAISGSGGLVKAGAGVFTLSGANSYSGLTQVAGGTLRLGSLGALADDSTLQVLNGATLDLNGFDEIVANFTIQGNLVGGGTLSAITYNFLGGSIDHDLGGGAIYQQVGTTVLNGVSAGSAVHVDGGVLRLGASDRLADTAVVTVAAGGALDLQGFDETVGALALAGVLDGAGTLSATTYTLDGATVNAGLGTGALIQASGVSRLNGATAAGTVRVDGGALGLGGADRLADTATVTVVNGATLDLRGFSDTVGTLNLAGALTGGGALSADRYTLNGATIDADLRGGLLIQAGGASVLRGDATGVSARIDGGALRIGDGGVTGSLDGDMAVGGALVFDRSDATTYAGTLSGRGTLAQVGGGTLTLTGDSADFTGATTVSGGGLVVDGRLGGSLAVTAGALTGAGGVGGAVTLADGARLLGATGRTLAMGALTLEAGSIVDVALSQPSNAALFDVAGDLTLDGALNVTALPGFGAGVYRLFDYGGALTDNGLTLGRVDGAAAEGLSVQTAVAGRVNLVNSANATLAFWDGGAAANHDNGRVDGGGGTWTLASRNWTDADGTVNGPMTPTPSFAVFQGAGGVVTIDNGGGQIGATGLQFASNGYTLAGGALALSGDQAIIRVGDGGAAGANLGATISASLTGGATLVKTDLGTLILTGVNSYTGGTVVRAGTLVGDAGSIRGAIRNDGVVVFDQASDATFGGAISGAGAMVKTGAGALTLGGTSGSDWRITGGSLVSTSALFTGDVDVGQGSSFIFDQAADGTYAGALTGSGDVLVRGGGVVRFTGDGSRFLGATTVGGGAGSNLLSVNGVLGGRIDVLAGARLQGAGTIGAGRIAGTIAPGNSIGTLTVSGALTFLSGGVFEVEADAEGRSDKIVVDGVATLESGATMNVLAADGNYAADTSYTVLTAGGGVTGAFSNVTSNLAFLAPTLSYGANAVTLNLKRNAIDFAAVARTGNQRAVAPAVEALGVGDPVHDAAVALTAPEARAAFDQLAGSDHASMRASLIEDSRFMREAMLSRVDTAGQEGSAGWGRVLGSWRTVDGDAEAQGYKRSLDGFITGLDGALNSHWRGGVAFGYANEELRTSNATHQADTYQAGASLLGGYGRVSIQVGGAYAWHTVDSRRHVAFGGLDQRLNGQYDARSLQGFGEVAVRTGLRAVDLQPFAGLAHVALLDADVNERGGAAALRAGQKGLDATYGTVGLRARVGWDLGGSRLSLDGATAVRRTFGDRSSSMDVAFARGAAFEVDGVPLERTEATVDLGFKLDLDARVQMGASFSGAYSSGSTDQGARAELTWRF